MRSEGYGTCSVCVCVSVTQHLTFQRDYSCKKRAAESFKRFSLETLRCGARAFPVGMATRLVGHF